MRGGPASTTVWVVRVRPDGEFGWRRAAEYLNQEDQARCAAMRHDDDRHRLAVSRLALHELVRSYLPGSPSPLVIDHSRHRAPRLGGSDLRMSLAHAGQLVVCAVSPQPIGVDVETLPAADPSPAVVQRYFSAGEQASLEAVAPPERAAAFLRIWVRKEAVVKSVGWGMDVDLRQIDVRVCSPSVPDLAARLRLTDVDLPGEAVAAIASHPDLPLRIDHPNEA